MGPPPGSTTTAPPPQGALPSSSLPNQYIPGEGRVFSPIFPLGESLASRANLSTPVPRSDGGREPRLHVVLGPRRFPPHPIPLFSNFQLPSDGRTRCEVPLNELISPLLESSPSSHLPHEVQSTGGDRDHGEVIRARGTSQARPSSSGHRSPSRRAQQRGRSSRRGSESDAPRPSLTRPVLDSASRGTKSEFL